MIFQLSKYYILFLIVVALCVPHNVFAGVIEDLQAKINDRNSQIKALEDEIDQYNKEVEKVGKQASTLKGAIQALDLTQKKVDASLALTSSRIQKVTLTIQSLAYSISTTSGGIDSNKQLLRTLVTEVYRQEQENPIEALLASKTFSEMWTTVDRMRQTQKQVTIKTNELHDLKDNLSNRKVESEKAQKELSALKEKLQDEKKIVEYNKKEKANLLAQTKNTEANYRALLKDRQAKKDAFEQEVFNYESQLKIAIDPSSIPTNRVLSWPLDRVIITQTFGKTVAAKKLYVSGSHNGVDFGAPIGTPVKSTLSGTVVGTGNTDEFSGCYSFGKWIMVKHNNGLSTIYGHLSLIKVVVGQQVATGEVIGYSGNTGYSTGPHLHLGVYATQGVRIEKFVNSRACKQAVLPIADIKAYLDPLQYLPAL